MFSCWVCLIDEAFASLPTQLKKDPAQNVEMKISARRGQDAAGTPTGLRHCPLAACLEATSTSGHAEEVMPQR